jgi:mRNA-degrading endonuclease RelE of RelBE toxin-antitoxin system
MSYEYLLHDYAQEDYEQSLKWYAEKSFQTANNFVTTIDNALLLICNNPTRWHNKYKDYFEFGLKKYPFTIIYKIEKDKHLIIVLSVYHYKRNPKKKYRKV